MKVLDQARRAIVKRLGGIMKDEAVYASMTEHIARTEHHIVPIRSVQVIPPHANHFDYDAFRLRIEMDLARCMKENGFIKTEAKKDNAGNTILTATVYVANLNE